MKFFKQIITLIIIFLFFNISNAQQQCAFDDERQKQLQDPNFVELQKTAEKRIQKAINSNSFSKMAGGVLNIPVVIHVLHLGEAVGTGTNISNAQIQSSIDNLNDYYRGQIATSPTDFEIEFALAQRDPSCNSTTGINRIDASSLPGYSANGVNVNGNSGASYNDIVALSSWPQTDYFNVWIVSELDGNNGGSGFQGYAYFYNENSNHGSVMMSSVFGYDPGNTNGWGLNSNGDNSTVVHEVGHFFHLYHTFQGDGSGATCPADATIGTDSDGCADTVPHRRETSTCPVLNSCTGFPWVNNNTVNNIMSYYYCSDKLTPDQKTRVRAAMEGTAIVNSKGSEPLDPTYAAPVAACNVNPSPSVFSGILSVELNGNTETSSHSQNDGGNIDETTCSNSFIIDSSVSNTLNVEVYTYNFQQLGVWIDWNNDGDFNDDAENQHFSKDISENTIVAIVLSYPVVIPYGDNVRMRLITDADDRYTGVGLINSSCYPNLTYGQSEDYSIYVESSGSTTYTYNNGWSPSNPIGSSSSIDTFIVQTGTANISANTNCNTLTVNPGAAVTIDSGVTLTATTVDLNSTSQTFSSLISDGTIDGTVNYNRHVALVGSAPLGTNDLISAPLSGQLFPVFDVNNPNLPASGTIRAFAPYNTSAGEFQNYDLISNVLTVINAGNSFRAATTDGGTLTFTGTVSTNDVLDVPISDAAAGSAWNLIGNPYPSYIDFDTFFNANYGEFQSGTAYQAIYGYDGDTSNGWTVWNLATIANTAVTELIAPGQAFFVKSKPSGGLVDFTRSMRRTGSSDDFISGRNTNTNVALCQLNLNSLSNNASTQIYFIEGTTRGLDNGYDAGSYLGSAADYSIFSNLVEDNTGLDMAIQTLPYSDFNDVIVPLGINAEANEELTISIDDVSTLPSDINVYLEDTFKNTLTLLNNSNYTFTSVTELNGTGRFYLRYSNVVLSVKDNNFSNLQIYATASPKELVVNGLLTDETHTNVYDIQGRLVLKTNLNISSTSNTIDVSTLTTGIYIVKVSNNNQTKTQKVIIR